MSSMNQLDTERDGFYHVWTLGDRLRVARERVAKTQEPNYAAALAAEADWGAQ